MALSEASVKTSIQRLLGQDGTSGVVVELTSNMIQECIDQTLRLYNRYRSKRVTANLPLVSGTDVYNLGDLGYSYGRGIVEVVPRQPLTPDLTDLDMFNPYSTWRRPTMISGLATDIQHIKLARKVTSSEFGWEWDQDEGILYISGASGLSAVMYTYLLGRTMAQVPPQDEDWIIRMAMVQGKYTLGRIRRKYTTVRGSEHELTLDGDSLLNEHSSELQPLMQELRNRCGDIGVPIRG